MLFQNAAHAGKSVRLAYCMNLHAAETLDELIGGMQRITLPLRERLAKGREFGVGMYLPAVLARELANDAAKLAKLKRFLDEHALDPFTYNAFPYGGFQTDGLKERVFEPTWWERERADFTRDVANVAARLAGGGAERHISISTHTGAHSSRVEPSQRDDRIRACLMEWRALCDHLARIESETGRRLILALEPEPHALIGSYVALLPMKYLGAGASSSPDAAAKRHLGYCFDACHAAVEFEVADCGFGALSLVGDDVGAGLGKIQFTSALSLLDAPDNERGRQALFALDEPRYLHQVHGQSPNSVARASDLPMLIRAWADESSAWHECDEWRCHFHVPVDVQQLQGVGLSTTRDFADSSLRTALDHPEEWGKPELHVEIETYTWDVLPRAARGAGELVDGLEREYRHVIALLEKAGWRAA